MGRRKNNPYYDPVGLTLELVEAILNDYYNPTFETIDPTSKKMQITKLAAKYGFSVLKMRRILVSAGAYKSVKGIQIQKLYYEGRTFDEIVKLSGLKRASVISYLPYERTIYNLPERSPGAIRALRHRRRTRVKKEGRNIKTPTCPMMWIYEYDMQPKGIRGKQFFRTVEIAL